MEIRRKEAERYVESVLKTLDILNCFENSDGLKLKELSSMTDLNKSRIIRLCGSLEAKGYLIYDTDSAVYRLGPKLLVLGMAYRRNNTLVSLARPSLKELSRLTGESVGLFTIDNSQRICLAKSIGTHSLHLYIVEGQRVELYAGATGKVLLAYAPEDFVCKIINNKKLKKLTPNTIVDFKKFQKEFETIRRRGYAVSFGERTLDTAAVAAPVFNHVNEVCAAIGLAGPIPRFLKEYQSKYIKAVMDAAQQLSKNLGYGP